MLAKIKDDYNTCDGSEYNNNEISIRDVEDGWTIEIDDADTYDVSGSVRVKYKDEGKCYEWFDFDVEYDGEDVHTEVDS